MDSLDEVRARAAVVSHPVDAVIGGRTRAAAAGGRFINIGPGDGRSLGEVAACDAADVDAAVAAGREAFEDGRWRDVAPKVRKAVLHRLAALMEQHADELALLESLDTGKPISDACGVDIPLAVQTTHYYAEALDKLYGEVAPSAPGRLSYAIHEPLGVIARSCRGISRCTWRCGRWRRHWRWATRSC